MRRTHTAFRLVADADGDRRSIALLDADPSLAEAIPPADRALAAGVRLPLVDLAPGAWNGPSAASADCGWLVLRGLVVRTLRRYGRTNAEIHGPGDLVTNVGPEDGAASWNVVRPASLVGLDERFEVAARRWPALWRVTLERSEQRSERLAAHLSALQQSRVDARIEAVLWQLADRFGKVTTEGVVVPVPLTHETVGRLAAAKRPTVSVALAELADKGRVARLSDGSWLLRRPGLGEQAFAGERRARSR